MASCSLLHLEALSWELVEICSVSQLDFGLEMKLIFLLNLLARSFEMSHTLGFGSSEDLFQNWQCNGHEQAQFFSVDSSACSRKA